jgi:flagellar FliJ protein
MLIDLARTNADRRRGTALGALQSAHLSAHQKLELLLQYRQDYHDQLDALMRTACRLRSGATTATSSARWTAPSSSSAPLPPRPSRLDHGRTDWQHHKRRLSSFDTLAERVRAGARWSSAKREQRDSDERAARKFFDRASHPTL